MEEDGAAGTTNGNISWKRGGPEVPDNEATCVAAEVKVAEATMAAGSSGAQPWEVLPQ